MSGLPFALEGPPSRWVVRGGRPADVVWNYAPSPGLPSYETEDGKLLVFDQLQVWDQGGAFEDHGEFAGARTDRLMLVPRSYGESAVRDVMAGGGGLCCLWDDPVAWWRWRPLLYNLLDPGFFHGERPKGLVLQRLGSQRELTWRYGLVYALMDRLDRMEAAEEPRRIGEMVQVDVELSSAGRMEVANRKADRLLREHLEWWQLFDLDTWGYFFEVGETRTFKLEGGNGFAVVDPVTRAPVASYCLHPEEWLPDSDVMLAQVLLIREGEDGERELLEGARPGGRYRRRRATAGERKAHELEREWITS